MNLRLATLLASLALIGCSDAAPRYGALVVSASSPSARLSGQTTGATPALEMRPGCAGFLDPATPMHRVQVTEGMGATMIAARSNAGPVGLVVRTSDQVFCESDGGAGHAPRLLLTVAGTYDIYVAALNQPAVLAYTLDVGPYDATATPDVTTPSGVLRVAVTITSSPHGATVTRPTGEALGTTPLMITEEVTGPQVLTYALHLEGHADATVAGTPTGGALVLDQTMQPASRELDLAATGSAAIRDNHTTTMDAALAEACVIADMSASLDFRHSFTSDLVISLRSPSGTVANLQRHRSGRLRAIELGDARLGAFRGEQASGEWRLSILDDVGADSGTLHGFSLHFQCARPGEAIAAAVAPRATSTSNATPTRTLPPRSQDVLDPWSQRPQPHTPRPPVQAFNGPSGGPGLTSWADVFGPSQGQPAPNPPPAPAPPTTQRGTIAITSTPSGTATLDGISLGPTPISLQTNVGRHVVTIVDAQGRAHTRNVDVRPDAQVAVRMDLDTTDTAPVP